MFLVNMVIFLSLFSEIVNSIEDMSSPVFKERWEIKIF